MSEEIKMSEELEEQHYGENEIQVLEGLEAVRKRLTAKKAGTAKSAAGFMKMRTCLTI